MPRIALFYRIYFLYVEPLAALLGAIGVFTNPYSILESITPKLMNPAAAAPITPLTRLLLTNIGALYLLFAWNQAVVLRLTTDLNVWRAMLIGMVLSDVGHLWAFYEGDPKVFFEPWVWGFNEWMGEGVLAFGFLVRLIFLAGIGVRSGPSRQK